VPSFKKTSRFDFGEKPPRIEKYPDWRREETRVVIHVLQGDETYADALAFIRAQHGEILEELTSLQTVMEKRFAAFRVKK
jgi:hypothetical protein